MLHIILILIFSISDSPRPFTSTTAVQRHRSIFDPLSSPTFKTSSPIVNNYIYNDHSPTHLPLNRSKLSSQKLNFCDFDEEENFEWDKSVSLASIGPKNLLSVRKCFSKLCCSNNNNNEFLIFFFNTFRPSMKLKKKNPTKYNLV